MVKVNLNDVTNIQNEQSFTTVFNTNNARIEAAMENTLSRDGTAPNEMNSYLDMNNHPIYNLPEPTTALNPVRLRDLQEWVAETGNLLIATQAEAEAGAENSHYMTPLRVKQAIDALAPGGGGGDLGIQVVNNRTDLSTLSTTFGSALLNEGVRSGLFVWSSANLSSHVAADTRQGLYVAPSSDPTGASGAWARLLDRLGEVSADWWGAVGDGTTNDQAAIQAAMTVLSTIAIRQRTVVLTGRHVVDTDLTIPENITLKGIKWMCGGIDATLYLARNPSIILNSAAKITMGTASELRELLIYRKGLVIPTTSTTVALFAGTAVYLPSGLADYVLEDLLILGFEYGVRTDAASGNTSRGNINRVKGDCTNGIYLHASLDVNNVSNCHWWPFTSAISTPELHNAQNRRGGAAYFLEGPMDWTEFYCNFSFGYARGLRLKDCDNMSIIAGAHDGHGEVGYLDGFIGVLVEGACHHISLFGTRVASQQYGFWVNVSDSRSDIQLFGCRALANITASFYMERGRIHIIGGGGDALARGGSGLVCKSTVEEVRASHMYLFDYAIGVNNDSTSTRCILDNINYSQCITRIINMYLPTIASADPLVVDGETLFYQVTGTAPFSSILEPSEYTGKILNLTFTGACTVNTGGNLRLNGNTTFAATSNDTLTLMSTGSVWLEISRCANP